MWPSIARLSECPRGQVALPTATLHSSPTANRGCVGSRVQDRSYGLYVHPRVWSTCKGRQLHDSALAALKAEGTTVVTLWVLTSNDRARRFYSQRGWQLEGATKVVELDGVTLSELRYQRTLEPNALCSVASDPHQDSP
jgi:GNAT superfamily N-acetyltransferase